MAKPTDMKDSQDSVRDAFERWAGAQGLRLAIRDMVGSARLGQYCDDNTQLAWEAYRGALQAQQVCTCPSGDGSLSWPCPSHPPLAPASPEAQRDSVDLMRSILARDQWNEAWRGTKHMQLKLSYEVDAWERIMRKIEASAVSAASTVGAVTDEMVNAYAEAVNAYLGSLTEKDWEIERRDPAAAIRRAARIGLTAALTALPAAGEGNGNG